MKARRFGDEEAQARRLRQRVEAKSGGYWIKQTSSESGLAKFKSDMGDRLRIAKENDVDYELFSNSSIPENIKTWLYGKGIKYYEILE